MREQFLSASPMPHSLDTFLADQESIASGRDLNQQYRKREAHNPPLYFLLQVFDCISKGCYTEP